tara:strand:+ start:7061 stop:8008 length:948 start_codon:yes stop_codon:yes gene_type:complete
MTDEIELVMQKVYYEKLYDNWVSNFALNLQDIWIENSGKELTPKKNPKTSIVIGKGPSIKEHRHLELLAKSEFQGNIICCDGALITTLKAGVTPDKFPNFYVVSIEARQGLKKYFDDELVRKFGDKIKGIFSVVADPEAIDVARKAGIKIHWMHALFDYEEGKKSFNQISAMMIRSKKQSGLPGLQTGGNVGTTSWFFGWRILKSETVALIGINHGWNESDSWEMITSHGFEVEPPKIDHNSPSFNKLFPKIYNPEFDCNCILDPIFLYYSKALKEFISRSPQNINTINATEGGVIFGDRIKCMKFSTFLENNKI